MTIAFTGIQCALSMSKLITFLFDVYGVPEGAFSWRFFGVKMKVTLYSY